MKKFLTLLIALCLILCACGGDWQQSSSMVSSSPEVSPSVSADTDTEYIIASDIGSKNLKPRQLEYLNKSIYEITAANGVFDYKEYKNLQDKGIDIKLKQVYKIDNDNIKITVDFISTAGNILTKQYTSKLNYMINDFNVTSARITGTHAYSDGKRLFLSGVGYTEMYDSKDFSLVKELDYSCIGEKEFYIAGFSSFEKGYVSAYVTKNLQGLVYFDSEGNFTKHQPLDIKNHRSHFFGCVNPDCVDKRYNMTVDLEKFSTLETKGDLMFFDTYDKQVCDSRTNTLYYMGNSVKASKNNIEYRLCHITPVGENINGDRFLAIKQDDEDIEYFTADTHMADHSFGYENKTTVTISGENMLGIYCEVNNCDATIDFGSKTINFIHRKFAPPENEYDIIAKKNGYTLYRAGGYGGGDVSYSRIVLGEDATGKTKYIDTLGGMYGGNCDRGFFSNGEVYVIDTDGFKIYSTDMNETGHYFRLGDKFSFGDNISHDINLRYLLAARRDPVNKDFITIYFELPYTDYYGKFVDYTSDSGKLIATYKVGLFDKNGNFIKEYDTEENVNWNNFGICPVDMYKTGNNTIEFYTTHKGHMNSDVYRVNVADGSVDVRQVLGISYNYDCYAYLGDSIYHGKKIMLHNNYTGRDIYIRDDHTGSKNIVDFFKNDTIGIRQSDSYIIYNTKGEQLWELGQGSFKFGPSPEKGVDYRRLIAVDRPYDSLPVTALYYDMPQAKINMVNDYQLEPLYKIALFDQNNRLEKILETDLYSFGTSCTVHIAKPYDNKIKIDVYNGYKTLTRGYIDTATGSYIREYTAEDFIPAK